VLKNYTGQSRDVAISHNETQYKITIPAQSLEGQPWTKQSLREHIEYYLEYYKKSAVRLDTNEIELAESPDLTMHELKVLGTVLFRALNITRQQAGLQKIPKEMIIAEIKELLEKRESDI